MSRPATIVKFLPFTSWSPDLGVYDNPGLIEAENLFPSPAGFSQPLSAASIQNLANVSIGLGTHPDTDRLFYGSTAGLFDLAVGGAEEDRSGAVYTAEALPIGWSFLPFGGDIIAAGGTTQRPQYMDADAASGTNFADLLDATTIARTDLMPRYVCAVGQHVMFGYINDALPAPDVLYPDRVWLSAINNARRFGTQLTDPALLTTYQDLYDDYGHITGLSGGNDYAYIFKQKAIYRMDFAGPFGLTFKPISLGTGTVAPHSIVEVDGDVYFWGGNGPAVIRQGGTVVGLVSTEFARLLLSADTNNYGDQFPLFYVSNKGGVRGWFCPYSRCVCWAMESIEYVTTTNVAVILMLNVDTGTWGYSKAPSVSGAAASSIRGAATKFLAPGANWEFGGLQYLVTGSSASKLRTFSGTPSNVTIQTPRAMAVDLLGDRFPTAKVTRLRPRLRHSLGSDIAISVTVTSYNTTWTSASAQATTTSEANAEANGFLTCETDYAQAFDFRVVFSASASTAERIRELSGMDVEFDVSGTKGP